MKITRDELLIAAFKLFMSVNYEKASFAELGKMLGMSKAGIFKYYKNKQELFIAVVDKFGDYAYWRTAIQRAINTGELRKDVDVEDAVVMFRQVYMGLSFEMSFLGGLDTERLAKHLRAVYSLLKC